MVAVEVVIVIDGKDSSGDGIDNDGHCDGDDYGGGNESDSSGHRDWSDDGNSDDKGCGHGSINMVKVVEVMTVEVIEAKIAVVVETIKVVVMEAMVMVLVLEKWWG